MSWAWLSDFTFTFTHWRRKWQPTPVFLPGESQGPRSLVGCYLSGRTELDTTEAAAGTSVDSALLLKRLFFLHWINYLHILENQLLIYVWPYLCSLDLFCYLYIYITLSLNFDSVNPPNLILIFKMLLAILGTLHFHKSFRIKILISEKQVFEDFEWDYVEYVNQFGVKWPLNLIESFEPWAKSISSLFRFLWFF